MQYNCQKSSNFQGLSHFSRIFGKNDKIPGFFQAGKTVTIFPGFPGAVGTLYDDQGQGNLNVIAILRSRSSQNQILMCFDFYPEAGSWLSSECLSFLFDLNLKVPTLILKSRRDD